MISGGTPARGAILFAGAALIVVDRIRAARAIPVRIESPPVKPGRFAASHPTEPIQKLMGSSRLVLLAAGGALVASGFAVHSWPLTATVGLTGVLGLGWAWLTLGNPPAVHRVQVSGWLPWAMVLLALAVWEMTALVGQPTLEEGSYAHPTISYLLDPILATYPGRLVGLLVWLAAGRALVRRA